MPKFDLIAILAMIAVVASAIIAGSLFPSGKSSIVTTSTIRTNASSDASTGVGGGGEVDNGAGTNMATFRSFGSISNH
jgi:hypothetical protein